LGTVGSTESLMIEASIGRWKASPWCGNSSSTPRKLLSELKQFPRPASGDLWQALAEKQHPPRTGRHQLHRIRLVTPWFSSLIRGDPVKGREGPASCRGDGAVDVVLSLAPFLNSVTLCERAHHAEERLPKIRRAMPPMTISSVGRAFEGEQHGGPPWSGRGVGGVLSTVDSTAGGQAHHNPEARPSPRAPGGR